MAYEAGDLPRNQHAIKAMQAFLLTHSSTSYGDALHLEHIYLGLFALDNGDTDTAILALLKAGKVPSSPVLKSFGPNMLLAKRLLEADEPEAVLQYLRFCKEFWAFPFYLLRVPKWIKVIRAGEVPDFGANLVYHLNVAQPSVAG